MQQSMPLPIQPSPSPWMLSMGLGVAVFLLSLLGILTRPGSDLAAFWPANAFMLGMLVRFPRLSGLATWICCALGYVLADHLTGNQLSRNLVLNTGNLLAVAGGYAVLRPLPGEHRQLRTANSILYLLAAVCFAALLPALLGTMADPMLFGGSPLGGFAYWGVTELVNMIAFLPMLLTVPSMQDTREAFRRWTDIAWRRRLVSSIPFFALVLSSVGSVLVGGPGAVAFPVPMLLWCAVSYPLFITACLCLCYVAWSLLAISTGMIPVAVDFNSRPVLLSTRAGVALVVLAPLAVASAMVARDELLARLRHLAHHDALTEIPNRAAFFEHAVAALATTLDRGKPAALMMLDIDHFKNINDTYGHQIGDQVLRHFARILSANVRRGDFAARLGGEEFVVLLPDSNGDAARSMARRISEGFASTPLRLADGRDIAATVSIGVALATEPCSVDGLIGDADSALYRAKAGGRNRVEAPAMSSESPAGRS